MNKILTSLLFLLLFFSGASEGQVLLRYGANIDGGWGSSSLVATPYVVFPKAFVAPYVGNRITSVRIGLGQPATNVYLYIKNSPQDSKPLYRQKIGNLDKGWNDITLDTPFDIPAGADIAIGYKASFAESGGVGYSQEVYSDGDYIYYNSGGKWTSTGHSLCIQALVEGDNMPTGELMMSGMASQIAPYGATEATFSGWVRNVGANEVNAYSLRYSVDGEEKVIDVARKLEVNATDSFSITIPATEKGTHKLWVAVNSVDGQPDRYLPNDTAQATLTVRDVAFRRTVVCEEFTGLWCGFCPRGLVGLELMKEAYPDNFIAVSVHGGDALEIKDEESNYKPYIDSCTGAPMCNIDRRITGDPYNDIKNLFNMEQSAVNHVAYTLTARWNADSTAIDVASDYYSDIDISAPDYRIAYTVTEDSITGYSQTNYYSGNDSEFYGWEKKGNPTDDVVFNDVARAIYPDYAGAQCRTEPMKAYEHYTHTYTVPVPSSVVDRRNIHVVGQIIDGSTGYTQNAMSLVPVGETPSAITAASADSGVRAVRIGNMCRIVANGYNRTLRAEAYNAMGMLVDSQTFGSTAELRLPVNGVAIVRVVDGNRVVRTLKLK